MKTYKFFIWLLPIIMLAACTPKISRDQDVSGPPIRVLLATLDGRDTLLFEQPYNLISEEANYEFGERNRHLIIEPITDGIRLFNANRNLLYRNHFPIILEPVDAANRFSFRGQEYNGTIIFMPASKSSLYVINKLPLEEYLKSVVPAEIYATQPEYYQAVKAQAICARTYAIAKLESGSARPYDLKATIEDQVYSGSGRRTSFADQAVAETQGTVLTFNGQLAPVYYHSTCGGRIEAAVNLWPDKDPAYMQTGVDAVSDIFSCSASPYFRWIENRTITDLDSAFNARFGKTMFAELPADTLDVHFDMEVTKRTSGGRVNEVAIAYADTSVTLTGYEIRRFFAKKPATYLPSNLFYVSQASDSTLQLNGAGNGHGVGMCQFGAMNMAQRGFQHYHILGKYFPGTILTRKY